MKRFNYVVATLAALVALASSAVPSSAAPLVHRWVYLATNLLVDKNVEDALKLLDRAAKAGYNGVVLTDSKFMRWDQLPDRYLAKYQEGRDFQNAGDPKLGMILWPGGFTAWHEPPVMTIPSGSRIRDGQKVLLSYFHTALIYEEQVACCMAEPKVYEILRWQIAQVHNQH